MTIHVGAVLSAYRDTLQRAEKGMEGGAAAAQGPGFSGILENMLDNTTGALKNVEQVGIKAAAGAAGINEIVSAVSAADIALQTVVAIRDKFVSAYQELLRSGM